ncbi:VWA domain-containing protein [Aureimonas fodinaquatilis]|uniref:VWA domain-containing protein n=1 Tax=Aureimonas fodinaquatilis TaxID=2565783 RepID=A0A5B0DU47_9HYPH|nr:VWA domain-containing protein [Aureimonas fodinaquatilis]KAA0969080.1 VWA domain-containing protein [Aureimonas fodinaquatilis]
MMADFHFLRPWWLLALFGPPAFIWLASHAGDIRNQWKGLIAPHLLNRLVVEPPKRRRMLPAWCMAAVLALAAVGLAGPAWHREPPPFVSDTASLVILIDLSADMDSKDVSPSRLERAKLKIHDILDNRPGSRTAVIAYAGTAHLVVPLTDDADLIQSYTDALATRLMPRPGKDTAAALKMARALLQADGAPGTVLMLTDGVEAAATQALDSSTVILGFGTVSGGLDVDALKGLSSTGAAVATMTDDGQDVRWITQQVQTNFASAAASDGDRWRDEGWYLLLPLAALLALSFRRGWVVRITALLLAAQLFLPAQSHASEWRNIWLTPDQQGRLAFEREDFTSAAQLFHDPLWKAVALYRAGNFALAADTFPTNTPAGWFNKGDALLRAGRFDDSVSAFETALAGRQNWPEAEANLALAKRLLQQQQDDEDQPSDPNEKPDNVQFDDKGKQGKAGTVDMAEQTTDMWMKNIEVSPADLMARKFAIEARKAGQ